MREIVWLGRGVFNDETDGHVDNLCCFVRPGEVALTWCDDPEDPQYDISHAAYEVLVKAKDASGRRLKVHKLNQPGPLYMSEQEAAGIERSSGAKQRRAGDRLAASYANFYITNRHILMPLLDARTDRAAEGDARPAVPAPQGDRRALARDPARRRQHPLHHPAAAAEAVKGDAPLFPGGTSNLTKRQLKKGCVPFYCFASRSMPQTMRRAPPTRQASSGRTGKPSRP